MLILKHCKCYALINFHKIRLNLIAMATLTIKDLRNPQEYTIDRLRQVSCQDQQFQLYYLSKVNIEGMDFQNLKKVQVQAMKLDYHNQDERILAKLIFTVIEIRRKILNLDHPEGKIDLAKNKFKEFTASFKNFSVWKFCNQAFSSLTQSQCSKSKTQRIGLQTLDEEQNKYLNTAEQIDKLQKNESFFASSL